jgi:protein tyrosine kinase modulator
MNQAAPREQIIRDFLLQAESHARGMWRYRWPAAVVAWLLCMVGWVAVYLMPNVYEANARIYVDTESAIPFLLQGLATSSSVMNDVTVVTREMLSRPNLAEVARNTDLDLRASSDKEFEELLRSLQTKIDVSGSRENIFSISYTDRDRETAIAVVDSLVNTFIEKSLGIERNKSSKAQSFLREQIALYEDRLTEAEDRLARFKQENVAVMPGQQGDYFARLQKESAALQGLENELKIAQQRRAQLLRQFEGEEPVFGIMSESAGQTGGANAAKIRELEIQLEDLRLRYTDKHPQIGQILDTLELLKKQDAEARAVARSNPASAASAGAGLEMNPVYQNMRIQLTNTEVEIAALREAASQKRDEVSQLQRLVETGPQVEAELNRLNRDYDVVKAQHRQLLQQFESASISEEVESSIDDLQIRIIDPPFAGLKPAGPKRQIFLAVVFFGGLGAAALMAFALNQLNPVFFSGRAVTSVTGIPVLGSISLTLTEQGMRQKRSSRFRFATVLGLLFVSFVLMAIFANQWSPALRDLSNLVS